MAAEESRDPTAVMVRRIVAFGIDVILTTAVIAIAFVSLARSTEVPSYLHNACDIARIGSKVSNCVQIGNTIYTLEGSDVATVWLAGLAVSVGNLVLLQGATGGTVGKHTLALRVVDAHGARVRLRPRRGALVAARRRRVLLLPRRPDHRAVDHRPPARRRSRRQDVRGERRDLGAPPVATSASPLHVLERVTEHVERE